MGGGLCEELLRPCSSVSPAQGKAQHLGNDAVEGVGLGLQHAAHSLDGVVKPRAVHLCGVVCCVALRCGVEWYCEVRWKTGRLRKQGNLPGSFR